MISFIVPGVPVAQPRQRHRLVQGKKPFIQNYLPADNPVQAYKATVRLLASQAMNGAPPLFGPVILDVMFLLPRPKRVKGTQREPHPCRPDADNLVKAVKDALKGVCWKDDSQVCVLNVQKMYAAPGEALETSVQIRRFL